MNANKEETTPLRDWRTIRQEVNSGAMSAKGRRRVAMSGMKTAASVLFFVALVLGGVEVFGLFGSKPSALASTGPVRELTLSTDGVLDQAWLAKALALPANAPLVGLDLQKLQALVLKSGQVKRAVLTRKLPSSLAVAIEERSPVARVRTESDGDLLVAPDGVAYVGSGYNPDLVDSLPWLAGARLVRTETGLAPIAGMNFVADLLNKAQNETPWLYRTWEVVDIGRLAQDGEIEVRSSEISRIGFSTDYPFFIQLSRLDAALDRVQRPIETANVGLGPSVVMTLADAGTAPVRANQDRLPVSGAARSRPLAFPGFQDNPKSHP